MLTIEQIKQWEQDDDGWFIEPVTKHRVKLGNGIILGYGVTLGFYVKLGDNIELAENATSKGLNEQFRQFYMRQPEHIFTKWVAPNRMSPHFDGGTPIKDEKGAVIEVPKAKISDQQCDVGLHVMRYGMRPEWAGLCNANHGLIPLDVKVRSEDILFAGLPTMDMKLRVRRLEVLT